MKKGVVFSLVTTVIIVVLSKSVWAIDKVSRKSTTTLAQGRITEVTKQGITVKPRLGSAVMVPANDITTIRWDGAPKEFNLALQDEDSGRFEKALERYTKAAQAAPASAESLKTDIQYLIARTTAKIALVHRKKLDAAIKKLEAFTKTGADHFRYYESMRFLGRVYLAKQEFDKARMAFETFGKAPWSDYKMAAKIASARVMLKQNNVDGALAVYNDLIETGAKANSPGEASCQVEAMLGRATCLIRKKKFNDAIKSLEDVITQAAIHDNRTQAEAYVRQGDCFRQLGRTKEAILAYLHVPVLFPKERDLHSESLYHLARLWNAVGHSERGEEARAILATEYPNSKWTKKLATAGSG